MNNEQLIIGYFKNSLSEAERRHVQKLLKDDKAFKEEFDDYKSLRKAFEINEAIVLKSQLQELESNSSKTGSNSGLFIRYAIAAVLVAIIGISLFFTLNTRSIYDQYYEAYPNVYEPVVRGEGNNDANKAFVFYENNQYKKAQSEFEKLLEQEYNPNVAFYYGLSLLETEDYGEALERFENIPDQDFQFQEELLWYSALAYVQVENFTKARYQLTLLTQDKSSAYYQDAMSILDKLSQ